MTADPMLDLAALERRRQLSLRAATIALAVAVAGFPLGMAISGSDARETISGALFLAAIAGVVACPWIVRAWQSFMRRRMIVAAVAGRSDILHIDGENNQAASRQALSSPAFSLAAFLDSGLVEPFESAGVDHILTGDAHGVPFAVAEISLLDAKGYRMFGGVLASFRLAKARSGLTIVTRDRGLLGNLLAGAGSRVDRLPLEDPTFEGVFEVYGTDQVGGRVVLTTTMLERLKALDELADAHGFTCAFVQDHLLIAFRGMNWQCPPWRILTPVGDWLQGYATYLAGLVDLPVEIVRTLNLDVASATSTAPPVPANHGAISIDSSSGQIFSSALWRLVGEGGMALTYVLSGLLFGGLALFSGWYGLKEGFPSKLFWHLWGLIAAGLIYGMFAILTGLREVAKLAWRWDAPLRTLKR